MNIYVCAKQVPDTNEVKIDPVKGTLIRDHVESILNYDDANALEAALELKDSLKDVFITVVTMGPPQSEKMLRECLAMGADKAVLLSDKAFGGADTWATSNTLAAAIRKLGEERPADLVFTGRQAIDGDTAQVGPQLAQKLGLPQVTYVRNLKPDGESVIAKRQLEDGYQVVRVRLPALFTVVKELNVPRYMSIRGINRAYGQEIQLIRRKDLEILDDRIGLASSPTRVCRSFTPPLPPGGIVYSGPVKDQVSRFVQELEEKHIFQEADYEE